MGLLPLSFIVIDVRRFVYLHHILLLTNDEPMKNLYYQQLDLAFEENWAKKNTSSSKTIQHHSRRRIRNVIKSLSREKWKTYITNMIAEYGFN